MKKILAILMTAALLLTALSVASCGGGSNGNGGETQTDENGSVIHNDNNKDATDNGSDGTSASGDGTSASGEGNLPYDKDSAQAKLDELGKKEGYELVMKVTDANGEETVTTVGAKGNAWWTVSGDGSGRAVVQNDEQSVTVYNCSDGEWTLENTMVGQNMAAMIAIYGIGATMYLYMANSYDGSFTRAGTETVAGRSCIKYTYSASNFAASLKYNTSVDKDLGITMKWTIDVKDGGQRTGADMEVISFKTGSAVTTPAFPEAGEEYMDLDGTKGWPSNSFTALIPKAPGTVALSGVQGGQFVCRTTGASEADFKAYISALQGKGFSGDVSGISFDATDAAGNSITVSFVEESLTIMLSKAGE